MKEAKFLAVVLGIIIILGIGYNLITNFYKEKINNELTTYLVQKKGYSKADIAQINTTISKAPVVSSTIIFSDEPNAMYFYKPENGEFVQYTQAPAIYDNKQVYKHSELTE